MSLSLVRKIKAYKNSSHAFVNAINITVSRAGIASASVMRTNATKRVALRFSVPAGFEGAAHEHDLARMRRSVQRVELPVEATVSLGRRSGQLDIDLTVHNAARNHRLRVLFPTDITAHVCYADGAFDVVERPIRQIDSHDWREP